MIFDSLENLKLYEKDYPFLKEIRLFLEKGTPDLEKGPHILTPVLRYNAAAYRTSKTKDVYEIHHREADVHIVFEGTEKILAASRQLNAAAGPYEEAEDCALVKGDANASFILSKGMFLVFLPYEPHLPGVAAGEEMDIRKVIFKAPC